MGRVSLVCETPELAVDCQRADPSIAVVIPQRPRDGWLDAALNELRSADLLGVGLLTLPDLEDLVQLSEAARNARCEVVLAIVSSHDAAERDAATDLGIYVTSDIWPMLIALRLLNAGHLAPGHASTKHLTATDRLRLKPALVRGARRQGSLHSLNDGRVGIAHDSESVVLSLGAPSHVAYAISAIHRVERGLLRVSTSVDGVDRRTVMDVLFGPPRSLSDPASKAALTPYGLPMPQEELCTSPSRAASEAARIGFPVRVVLTSPDLRVWDHPELAIDMVDSAARVREVFRELVSLAELGEREERQDEPGVPRVLGVTVMDTARSLASLRVVATPLPEGLVATEVAFADPHGMATDDRTIMILPAEISKIEQRLGRLAGSSLILVERPAQRRANVEALADVLLRTCAFVHDHRAEVSRVELRPVCLLPDGSAEVREACVTVSDVFERSLAAKFA